MASSCPRCGAARGAGRYCSSCAFDFWGAAAGREQAPPTQPQPQPSVPTRSSTPTWVWIAVAVLLGAVLTVAGIAFLGGGGSGVGAAGASTAPPESSATARPTARLTAQPTPLPTVLATPAGPLQAQVGDAVQISCDGADCLNITVSQPSEHALYKGEYLNDTPEQAGWVYEQVYVKYVAVQDGATYNPFDWAVYADGRQLSSSAFVLNGPEPTLDSGTLPAGRSAEGWLVYEVPPSGEIVLSYEPNYSGPPVFEVVLRAK